MRVLIAHNRYQSSTPSGENRIVDSEIELLRGGGTEVVPFIEDSDELLHPGPVALATAMIGPVVSPRGIRRLRALLDRHRPDVVHLHNAFPLISPWVVRTAVGHHVPVVQTVHNYRHTCVAGMHLRDDRICEDCRSHRLPWPAVRHACYRGSHTQSAAMAIGQVVHRPTWQLVGRFLVASPKMCERLESTGISPERIQWRPTYAEDHGALDAPPSGGVAFVGRLEPAKGVGLLLDAWTPAVARRWGRLEIAGQGPLAGMVADRARRDPTVVWRGALDGRGVREVMLAARLIALPSLWFEGFPRVAAEAMCLGRPLLLWEGSGLGPIAEAGAGWALDDQPASWSHRLLELEMHGLAKAAVEARRFYEANCSPAVALRQLQDTYAAVSAERPTA